jgi:hypothetical protein
MWRTTSEAIMMCQRMDIENRKRKKKTLFFSFSLGDVSIGKKARDSYMIRVGSMNDCCDAVTGREATAASSDTDGVLNDDCLLYKSGGGVSSTV